MNHLLLDFNYKGFAFVHVLLQFEALKDNVRHFSFFPPGGGGILAHSLAHVASWLKVCE